MININEKKKIIKIIKKYNNCGGFVVDII